VFGFSFSEVVLIGVVTLVAVGPKRLPGMLRDFGAWMRKLRKMTTEVRQQTGIDEMLRAEGLHGGLNELRSLMRGGGGISAPMPPRIPFAPPEDPYANLQIDVSREYPPEGPDAKGALPDDLVATAVAAEVVATATETPSVAAEDASAAIQSASTATQSASAATQSASAATETASVATETVSAAPQTASVATEDANRPS
jgi:sec-independent protein translocase protein TatB